MTLIYMKFDFEIRRKDAAARVGNLIINGKRIETPAFMPVFNPLKPTIPMNEMKKEFGMQAIMTNAYMLLKNPELKEEALEKGIHKLLDFDGIVATDSGSYQLMVYGAVETSNKEILDFESKIGCEVGSFLDIPSPPDTYLPRAREHLQTTIERSKEAENQSFIVNAAVQGAKYPELRAESAKAIAGRFRLAAVGGIVPLMESYRYSELVDVIAATKQNLPYDTVVHAFGLGHPMIFPLATLLGCDLFDSAAYALYAAQNRYMTDYGTERLEDLEYIGCKCPVCFKHGIGIKKLYGQDLVKALARHNLHMCDSMVKKIRQAISVGRLWELVHLHSRTHPKLLQAVDALKSHGEWFSKLDPITKTRAMIYVGDESRYRGDVINSVNRMKNVSTQNTVALEPFGEVNEELLDMYPFNGVYCQGEEPPPKVRDIHKLRAIMEYQFGRGAKELLPDNIRIKRSKKTKRIRWIYEGKDMIASVRASDHFIIPHETLARRLWKKYPAPKLRIKMVDDAEVIECVKDGKSVMNKFVESIDVDLRAFDECIIVDKDDNFIGSATLTLSPVEIMDFKRGMAARTR